MYLKEGTTLSNDRYRITRFISSGGFGCTYQATHTMFNSQVAIKEFFVKSFCNRDENSQVSVPTDSNRAVVEKLMKKFIEEARSVFEMRHSGIVKVLDIFTENGTAYYVMDYISGQSLNQLIGDKGRLPEQQALKYIRQVSDALKYVHSFNRLHLDIKPGNIMIDDKDNAILIDFGASKHYDETSGENTSTLMGVNTPGYAPVEQARQGFSTFLPAADIYALGATLYKALTGITPPDATYLVAGMERLQPLPSDVSESTRNAIAKAMQPQVNMRPQTIDEFLAILDGRVTCDETITALYEPDDTKIDYPATTPDIYVAKVDSDSTPAIDKEKSASEISTKKNKFKKVVVLFFIILLMTLVVSIAFFSDGGGVRATEGTDSSVVAEEEVVTVEAEDPSYVSTTPEALPNESSSLEMTTQSTNPQKQTSTPARRDRTPAPAARPGAYPASNPIAPGTSKPAASDNQKPTQAKPDGSIHSKPEQKPLPEPPTIPVSPQGSSTETSPAHNGRNGCY